MVLSNEYKERILYSVVIPAHNESSVIDRCLKALTSGKDADQLEIIVVCNGCRDDTAQRAAQYPQVTVVETEIASKIAALNLGDQHASYFPIAYVDADIDLECDDLLEAFRALEEGEYLIVAPSLKVDLSRSNGFVKAFYSVWMDLPYFTTGNMVGSGVYILSEKGRRRFGAFPDVISDDGYVRSLYSNEERKMIANSQFTIFAPRTLKDLIKIKTRVRLGNMETRARFPDSASQVGGENGFKSMLNLLFKKPWKALNLALYLGVQMTTKSRSQKKFNQQDFSGWARDDSSRS